MKYDDASWHYGGNFPAGQPDEHGGTHIALFLKWCFSKGWAAELHRDEAPETVARVISGELSLNEHRSIFSVQGRSARRRLPTSG